MPKYIVAVITAYDTPGGPEEAAEDMNEAFGFLDTPHVTYAAESLQALPLPSTVPEVAAVFDS